MCYICLMRFTLSPEQKKFFVRKGYIAFDAIPQKEREIAQLVYELTDKRPLRLAMKKKIAAWPTFPQPFDYEQDCCLLVSCKHGWGLFFTFGFPDILTIYEEVDGEFMCYLFTKRFLDPIKHPIIY